MKTYVGVYVYVDPRFLISAQVGGEWSASPLGCFSPGERAPGTHWTGDWVSPRAGLDDVEKILDPTTTGTRIVIRTRAGIAQSVQQLGNGL
jgi:hypothetical protein